MFLFVILCFDADVILSLEKKMELVICHAAVFGFSLFFFMQFVTLYLWVGNENKVEWGTVGRRRAGW